MMNDKKLTTRLMTAEDIGAVMEIETDSFSDPWSVGQFEAILKGNNQTVLVAEKDGVLLGFGVVMTVLDECEILQIAVRKTGRREGTGFYLLEKMLDLGKTRGAGMFYLEVRASNEPARKLYEKTGFSETGLRKNYYSNPTEDAVLMSLVRPLI